MIPKAENVGKQIRLLVTVDKIEHPRPIITEAVFECRSCMIQHTLPQTSDDLRHWETCQECGGHTFKVVHDKCEYSDIQVVHCLYEGMPLDVILRGKLCDYYLTPGIYSVLGVLCVDTAQKPFRYYVNTVAEFKKRRK